MKNLIILTFTVLILSISVFSQSDIRKVDFQNYTYSPDFCGGEDKRKITVVDGIFSEAKEVDGFTDRLYFNIYKTTYGDLDGDGKEEAVIFSLCNTGGTGNFTEAYIFKIENGKPVHKTLLVGGDRAYGGLREARIENGLLIVESNDVGELGGACCPEYIVTSKYRFAGKTLTEIGKSTKRKIYPETRINFDKGKFGKTFSVTVKKDENIKRFVIGALSGQTLTVTKTSDKAQVSLWRGNAKVLEEDDSLIATLRENGDYVFEVRNYSGKDLTFNVTATIKSDAAAIGKIESIYTDLDADKCKTVELEEDGAGYYRGDCPGVGNYKLEVIEGDIRQTINVIQKQSGDKWELDFMRNVSSGFSSVGSKAEWRVKRINGNIQPVALIVRYNVSVPTEDGTNKNNSSLVVTKFDGEFVCITDVVPPMRKQNEKARELADVATSKPCLNRK